MDYRTRLVGKIVTGYLKRFPNTPALTLARKIYNENDNNLVFDSVERVRYIIRYHRGHAGVKSREFKHKQ
jgi:hypothetical protein